MIERERFRKSVVSVLTGQSYVIRRVSIREYLSMLGVLPVGLAEPVQKQLESLGERMRERAQTDPEAEGKTVEFALRNGVVEPRIWFGAGDECPEDQVARGDLADDASFLANEVYAFSFDFAGLKSMEKFFRGAGAGDTRPDGGAVRPEAVVPAPEKDVPVGNGGPGI